MASLNRQIIKHPGKKIPEAESEINVEPEALINVEQLCITDLDLKADISKIDEDDFNLWCELADTKNIVSPLPPATSVSTPASENDSLTRNIALASKEKTDSIREVLHVSSMSNATHKVITSVSKKMRKRKRSATPPPPPPPMIWSPSPSPPPTPGNLDTIDYDNDHYNDYYNDDDAQRPSDTEDSETESSCAGPPKPKPAVYKPNTTPRKRKKFNIDNFLADSDCEDISSENTGSETEREINEVKESVETFIDDSTALFVSNQATPDKITNPYISTQAKENPKKSVLLSPGGSAPAKLHEIGYSFTKEYRKQKAKIYLSANGMFMLVL